MAAAMWEEIAQARKENRRELLLHGPQISERIARSGLDNTVFSLGLLNYLEISDSTLTELSNDIGNLVNLINLVLRGNKLTTLPSTIGNLKALRLLDISHNLIKSLPNEISDLSELHTFDANQNGLLCLPESINKLHRLSVVNISCNEIDSLEPFCTEQLTHLSEFLGSKNAIVNIPESISKLQSLKKLDLSSNKISEVPSSLADCSKLKELLMKENPFRDRRLGKLVQQSRSTKATLDYIRSHGTKTASVQENISSTKSKKKKGHKKAASAGSDLSEDLDKLTLRVLSYKDSTDGGVEVNVSNDVAEVRPYIVCCILRDVNLKQGNTFKRFISAQTKLHDGPLCAKRTKATIATHDFSLVQFPLSYQVKIPSAIQMVPLGRNKSTTANVLMLQLSKEADDMRKEAKRNTVSGIHKYLELLDGHQRYPCLCDKDGQVISFPPITNADVTKISRATDHIFLEVTSSTDLAACKKVMDALIQKSMEIFLNQPGSAAEEAQIQGLEGTGGDVKPEPSSDDLEASGGHKSLVVEQVKVIGADGSLKVVYPSRTDLQDMPDVKVIRS